MTMTTDRRAELEERLLQERGRVLERLGRHEESIATSDADGDLTLYPLHLADEGTDTMEQEKDLMLRSKEGQHLRLIDNALRKLYTEPERFGVCENCGEPIPDERLDLVPWTRYCMKCVESGLTPTND